MINLLHENVQFIHFISILGEQSIALLNTLLMELRMLINYCSDTNILATCQPGPSVSVSVSPTSTGFLPPSSFIERKSTH